LKQIRRFGKNQNLHKPPAAPKNGRASWTRGMGVGMTVREHYVQLKRGRTNKLIAVPELKGLIGV